MPIKLAELSRSELTRQGYDVEWHSWRCRTPSAARRSSISAFSGVVGDGKTTGLVDMLPG